MSGAIALGVLVATASCSAANNHIQRQPIAALCTGSPNDSARAAKITLDTLSKLDPFASMILRYSRDSTGFRIVTAPATSNVLDGMAIVRLNPECQVLSIVQTDSA